jgi:hypothetical protein
MINGNSLSVLPAAEANHVQQRGKTLGLSDELPLTSLTVICTEHRGKARAEL